jgi:hypothetical protein
MAASEDLRYDRLNIALSQMTDLLVANEEDHWAEWIGRARDRIVAGDGYGLKRLLGAYGGMGSLNDLNLGTERARFDALSEEAWSLATELLREVDRA